jgi:hypothetical protein
MEVAAVEEVVTTEPDPVVTVAGRFDQFRRDSRKRKGPEMQGTSMQSKRLMVSAGVEEGFYNMSSKDDGAKMFVASASDCYKSVELSDIPDTFQVYHKTIPGLKTPFDLPIECFPAIEKMLEGGAEVEIINTMFKGPVAESTAAGYKTVINRFHCYCMERGHTFPDFTKEAVLQFTHDCAAEGAGYWFFCKIVTEFKVTRKSFGRRTYGAHATGVLCSGRSEAAARQRERDCEEGHGLFLGHIRPSHRGGSRAIC